MALDFSNIPEVVIDYIRGVFGAANDKVTATLASHPSMWEGSLDHVLVMELTASPAVFFAAEQIGLSIESHWLGGRRMWDHRWEIADIALFVILRRRGQAELRKVALLQTKRLYAREIAVAELDEADFRIGIGRLIDRAEPVVPISNQRTFSLSEDCRYGAMRAGHEQVESIDAYMTTRGLPVYYGLYNPPTLPYQALYPPTAGAVPVKTNTVGCRVIPAPQVHAVLSTFDFGQSPTLKDLKLDAPIDPADPASTVGWRLERFVADEVMRCRQGQRFARGDDPNLQALLYERSAPITAAISIVVDFNGD